MASRLDRLITLLDTGSNPSVRLTAAKQLASAARRCLPEHLLSGSTKKQAHAGGEAAQLARREREDEGWADVLRLVGRVVPFLSSRSADTRNAAVEAVGRMAEGLPRWSPASGEEGKEEEPLEDLERLDVEQLVRNGAKLAASEYPAGTAAEPATSGSEASKRDMLRSLGIGDPLMLGGDSEELLDDGGASGGSGGTSKKRDHSPGSSPAPPGPPTNKRKKSTMFPGKASGKTHLEVPAASGGAASPGDIAADPAFAGISARQINLLKRKMKSGLSYAGAVEEAGRMRGGSAVGEASGSNTPGGSRQPSPSPLPPSRPASRNGAPMPKSSEAVVIDPAANIARKQADGQVNAGKKTAFVDLVPQPGQWPWQRTVDWLTAQVASPTWESRHGAALALRDIIKYHADASGMASARSHEANAAHRERLLLAIGQAAIRTLILDRFGDFVGDQLVAPVREAVSQTLGSVLKAMAASSVEIIHAYLIAMIHQPWCASATKADGYAWEVRHAGLLGLMYEVAVRSFPGQEIAQPASIRTEPVKQEPEDVKMEMADKVPEAGAEIQLLESVVDAAILGLGDNDDDVRSVAASCLVPVTATITAHMTRRHLTRLLDVLWSCLDDRIDDLGSSVAAVLDLLSRLVGTSAVIEHYSSPSIDEGPSLKDLIPLLFPFFRHTIASVRLATAKSVATMLSAGALAKDWLDDRLFRLLFENLVLEERQDVRTVTLTAWQAALRVADEADSNLWQIVLPHFVNWFSLALTPTHGPLPQALFLMAKASDSGSHNVDKSMMAGDMSLLSLDTVTRNRLEAIDALARVSQGSDNTLATVNDFMVSTSAWQLCLCGVFMQSKALADATLVSTHFAAPSRTTLGDRALAAYMDLLHNGFRMQHYFETTQLYEEVQRNYRACLDLKLQGMQKGSAEELFSLAAAESYLDKAKTSKQKPNQSGRLESLGAALERFQTENSILDIRVRASAAAAIIACRSLPPKLNPLIQNLVKGLKTETDEGLQGRFATAIASLVALCADPAQPAPMTVANKLVTNLATLLCQDETFSPQVSDAITDGIISHRQRRQGKQNGAGKKEKSAKPDEAKLAEDASINESRITRRGAQAAISAIIKQFGSGLFDVIPRLWEVMTEPLVAAFPADGSDVAPDTAQEVVDCLSVLRAIIPSLPAALAKQVAAVLPNLRYAVKSAVPLVRHSSSLCIATLCASLPLEGMAMAVEQVVPLLADVDHKEHRQGAIELIYHLVSNLDMLILPYVLFLVVPVLGRMSDPDEDVRLLSTNTFASLIRLVPLEEDIPDPDGFPESLMQKRETQRAFLMQLLDGSKVDQYEIPVSIQAELRPYQRDGVSWLAFLCRYQLHGILCDDMGLGKSLQTICIIASKHEERAVQHAEHPSIENKPLPSLIVCPPTLVGHWFYEFKKFAPHLRVLRYSGNSQERHGLRPSISRHDIIVTSYEAIRTDIDYLTNINWLFCALDEGHIIKNGKTKLSKAIKMLHANHRLILSGTPIQNNVLELWNLFDFLMPGFLGTEKQFVERYSRPILANRSGKASAKDQEAGILALDALHKQVLPFLLRRLKEDVLDDLPPKIVQDYYCDLSLVQKRLYDEFSRSRANAEAGRAVADGQGDQQHIFQTLQYLRRLCNHPWLAINQQTDQLQKIVQRAWADAPQPPPSDPLDIVHAPKLIALRQILLDCGIGVSAGPAEDANLDSDATANHRVLIFCQVKQMLDIVQRDLFARHMPTVTYMRLDGSTEANKRHDIVQAFNADPSVDVLLLTTQVGGLGLNLTGADTVIFVDHDWNPMKDLQAMDRAHRIGQKRVVNVYRLIMRGTLEEKIMGLQRFKLNIASSVVNQQNAGLATMNTNQVLDLFDVTDTDGADKKPADDGPVSQSEILKHLEDLPPESEYEGLSLDAFMSGL